MEQARLFTAIVLSFIVLFTWNYFFVDKEQFKPVAVETATESPLSGESNPSKGVTRNDADTQPSIDNPNGLMVNDSIPPVEFSKVITVNTPLYSVRLSNQGAVIKSMQLKKYRENVDKTSPLKEMVSPELTNGTIQLGFMNHSIPGLEKAVFTIDTPNDTIDVSNQTQTVRFLWKSPEGIIVEKLFSFKPDSYLMECDFILHNKSSRTLDDDLIVSLATKAPEGRRMYGFEGPFALIDNRIEQVKIKKIKEKHIYTGNVSWIAVTDRYFMSSIIPTDTQKAAMQLLLENNTLKTQFKQPTGTLSPGISRNYDFKLYMGPKSVSILEKQGYDLKKAVNFGFFDFIAKPCLWLMNSIYKFIPNYGIAIIILTVLIKILFWPLGTKSYSSMNEMKKLQPLMAEIREKYKNDKQKMNAEIMNLYKIYKVNPVSGCLPMIVQMPIFFALYRMLYEAIELRHAPFFGWIRDLSAPDRLLHFDFAIPFMQPPYGIPVLTIIMGATMFLQQKLSPQAGDPTQAKMMMFMPLIFTVIFINFSSGLVVYWLVNNILSIAQQYYVIKKNA